MRLVLTNKHVITLKTIIHLASITPLVVMYYWGISNQLEGDPVERLLHFSGISALNLLLLSLCITPLARNLKAAALIRCRRVIGLYSFTYALTHLLTYILFELQLDWTLLVSEIVKRPYITIGIAAFAILLSLAVTSTKRAQRKMGKKWQALHNLVYLSLILIITHYLWSVKLVIGQPIIYLMLAFFVLYFKRKWILSLLLP